METSSEEIVPEAIREEEIGSDEVPFLGSLNGGNGSTVHLLPLPSQIIPISGLTTKQPSCSGTLRVSEEFEHLANVLVSGRKGIAKRNAIIKEQTKQLVEAVDIIQELTIAAGGVPTCVNLNLAELIISEEIRVENEEFYDEQVAIALVQERFEEKNMQIQEQQERLDETMKLLEKERGQRLEADEKVVKLKESLKNVNEEFSKVIDQRGTKELLKEGEQNISTTTQETLDQLSKSVDERFGKMEKGQLELKTEVKQINYQLENLLESVNSLKNSRAPPVKNMPKPGIIVEPNIFSREPVKVGKVEGGAPKKRVQENGKVEEHAMKIPRKLEQNSAPIPIINLDDEDDEIFVIIPAPEELFLKNEGMVDPTSKNFIPHQKNHGYSLKNEKLGQFNCTCGEKCPSMKILQDHVYNENIKCRNLYCVYCDSFLSDRRTLITHLQEDHSAATSGLDPHSFIQLAQSIVHKQKMKKKSKKMSRHHQVSSNSLDKFICACGNKYKKETDFLKHIADF